MGILLGPHCRFRPQIWISCHRTTRPRNPYCCPHHCSFLCLRVQFLAHHCLQHQPCLRSRQRRSCSSALSPRRPAAILCPSSTPETWSLSTTLCNLYESPFLPPYLLPFHPTSSRTPVPPTVGPSKISWPLSPYTPQPFIMSKAPSLLLCQHLDSSKSSSV